MTNSSVHHTKRAILFSRNPFGIEWISGILLSEFHGSLYLVLLFPISSSVAGSSGFRVFVPCTPAKSPQLSILHVSVQLSFFYYFLHLALRILFQQFGSVEFFLLLSLTLNAIFALPISAQYAFFLPCLAVNLNLRLSMVEMFVRFSED